MLSTHVQKYYGTNFTSSTLITVAYVSASEIEVPQSDVSLDYRNS